eukprot:scaffold272005_cov15-Tisochrysis_lutea.AAC.1
MTENVLVRTFNLLSMHGLQTMMGVGSKAWDLDRLVATVIHGKDVARDLKEGNQRPHLIVSN